jgi:hypothetical protein
MPAGIASRSPTNVVKVLLVVAAPEVVARFQALWHASTQVEARVINGDAGAVSSMPPDVVEL